MSLQELIGSAIAEHNLTRTLDTCATYEEFVATSEFALLHRVRAMSPEVWTEILCAPALRGKLLSGVDMWKPRMEGLSKGEFEKYVTNTLSLLVLAQIIKERVTEIA